MVKTPGVTVTGAPRCWPLESYRGPVTQVAGCCWPPTQGGSQLVLLVTADRSQGVLPRQCRDPDWCPGDAP